MTSGGAVSGKKEAACFACTDLISSIGLPVLSRTASFANTKNVDEAE
jgi:hypothetical protein